MKALAAMSGGVDSSVAAFLLTGQGYDCAGVTMKLFDCEENDDARLAAARLSIPFSVFDCTDEFRDRVIAPFAAAYENGRTPNPCIACNRFLKFDLLYRRALETGFDKLATGHYARIEADPVSGRFLLKKAADPHKDQSYVLYTMTQTKLEHTLFPLGELTKREVREIAAELGLMNAEKRDSQDICFVPDGDYAGFIERYTGKAFPPGDFVDRSGQLLGRHNGMIRYTIGQRKGLGLALREPAYVCEKRPADNTVVLGKNEDLYGARLTAADFNFIALAGLERPLRVKARVRYKQEEQWATAEQTDDGIIQIEFDHPQRAIASGQAVVLYDGDAVVGGGTITG